MIYIQYLASGSETSVGVERDLPWRERRKHSRKEKVLDFWEGQEMTQSAKLLVKRSWKPVWMATMCWISTSSSTVGNRSWRNLKLRNQKAAGAGAAQKLRQASSDLTGFIKEGRQEVESERSSSEVTALRQQSEPKRQTPWVLAVNAQEHRVAAAPFRSILRSFRTAWWEGITGSLRHPLSTRKSFPLSSFRTFSRDCYGGHRAFTALGHNWAKTVTSSSSSIAVQQESSNLHLYFW